MHIALNNLSPKTIPEKIRLHVDDPLVINKLASDINERLSIYFHPGHDQLVILCIGTDRSTGDCLGPLVGSRLSQENFPYIQVCGTLNHPVHATNLKEKIDQIFAEHKSPFIIAIDACLGRLENVGTITVGNGAIFPGAGVNKNLPPIGDFHITGTVNVGGFMEYMVLQNTRLSLVMKMANIIGEGLILAIKSFFYS